MRTYLILCFALVYYTSEVAGQQFELEKINTNISAHFRALSVVDDHVAWVSGSQGTFGRTTNGGRNWKFNKVKDHEKLEFRSLFAFDSLRAVIANAGTPAYVFYTNDGGNNWKPVYTNNHQEAFIDGIDFWNTNEGLIYGDAIEGKMLLLITHDGGLTWKELSHAQRPQLEAGEGSFAASGTGIRCLNNKDVLIATGGKTSRLWHSADKGTSWKELRPPILQGETMTGIFSVAYRDPSYWIIVGGNYVQDTLKTNHVFYTTDGGSTWKKPAAPTRGLRECVEFIRAGIVLSSGLNGIDISFDNGVHWKSLTDDRQFSVIRKSRKGSTVILAGSAGKIALLKAVP